MGDVRAAADRWLDLLHAKGVPVDTDRFRANFADFIQRLRGRPTMGGFLQRAGAGKPAATDPFGDGLRSLKDGLESPEAVFVIQTILGFLFVLSTVEDIPMVGNLLSVSLDVATSGGRILMKSLQKVVPVLVGLIPLPYTSLLGLVLVAMLGLFVWPLLAMISFSRQDFTGAMDSLLRVIPPPMGETVAEAFLTVNTTAGRVGASANKFTGELVGGVDAIASLFKTLDTAVSDRAKAGLQVLRESLPPAPPAVLPAVVQPPPAVVQPPAPRGGQKPLSTKPRKGRKWREQSLYERFSGAGLR